MNKNWKTIILGQGLKSLKVAQQIKQGDNNIDINILVNSGEIFTYDEKTEVNDSDIILAIVKEKVAKEEVMITNEDIVKVKGLGFLRDKTTKDCFNARVITKNGKITSEISKVISNAAILFGNGEIALTSRMTIEIQKVPYHNIQSLIDFLSAYGLETGGTGPKVRPIVSCKGTTCNFGLIDTFSLSEEIHELFYKGYHEVKLPHKFKIAVGGCPNNCVKPDLNDVGIIGQRIPKIDLEKCRGCKICSIEKNCPINACQVINDKLVINLDKCNHCGRCVGKCPFDAVEKYTNGYLVYVGGRWGKKVSRGRALSQVFLNNDEVLNVVEKTILLFKEQGISGERFADMIDRLGFDYVQEELLKDDLLERKNNILGVKTC